MNNTLPTTREMIDSLIAAPSISSIIPAIDMGNEQVSHVLANWCESAGFQVEVDDYVQTFSPEETAWHGFDAQENIYFCRKRV